MYYLLTNLYNFIRFSSSTNTDIKLIQGDAVIYQPTEEEIVGLSSGRVYYVDPQPEAPPCQSNTS